MIDGAISHELHFVGRVQRGARVVELLIVAGFGVLVDLLAQETLIFLLILKSVSILDYLGWRLKRLTDVAILLMMVVVGDLEVVAYFVDVVDHGGISVRSHPEGRIMLA